MYNVEGKALKRQPEACTKGSHDKMENWQLSHVWQAVNVTLSHVWMELDYMERSFTQSSLP